MSEPRPEQPQKILRAPLVVTMAGEPIANGAVVTRGDRIAEVGAWNEIKANARGEVRELDGHALLPGLINAHCHLDYTDLRGELPRGGSFTDWIRAINARKSAWTTDDILRSIRRGFYEAARFGTTSVVNFEAYPDLIPQLLPAPLRTFWMAEMIDLREAIAPEKFLARKLDDPLSEMGLAPHALFTASPDLYRASSGARFVSTHLAESHEELQMFRDGEGALFEFLRALGRPMDDCGNMTPLAIFLSYQAADPHWIIAHLNELTPSDAQLLKTAPRFSIAHCPRSHAYFGHTKFPLQQLRTLGFNICVGTDSLASNEDLSLLAELRQLATSEPSLNARELLETVTTNAARALGLANRLGCIAVGSFADLIAIPTSENRGDVHEKIISYQGSVPWQMIAGAEREFA